MILTFTSRNSNKTYLRKKNIIYFEEQIDDIANKYTYIYCKGHVSVKVTETAEEVKSMINGDDLYEEI